MSMSSVCLGLFSCKFQPLPCVVALSSSLVIVPKCRSCARAALITVSSVCSSQTKLAECLALRGVFSNRFGFVLVVAALSSLIEIWIYSSCCVGLVSSEHKGNMPV